MEKVLIVGVIVLPLILFLAFFSDNVIDNTQGNTETAVTEADNLMDAVTE